MDTINTLAFDTTILATLGAAVALFPRLTWAVSGIVGTVVAASICTDVTAITVALCGLGIVLALADGGTAVDTGYLERAPDAATATVAATVTVRFLAPTWADDVSDATADRLLAQYSRAIASRHKSRAAKYRAAWIAHTRSALDTAAIA